MTTVGNSGVECAPSHVVGIYRRDHELVAAVVPFLAEALDHDGTAIVVATGPHRFAIDAALRAHGVPVEALVASGRYVSRDAAETLSTLVRDGRLERCEFDTVVSPMLDRAAPAGGPLRVFGEMVGLLWDAGDVAAAIELESMWNELAAQHIFALFCAYSMSSLEASADLGAVRRMCDRHSRVIPLHDIAPGAESDAATLPRDRYDRMFVAAPAALRDVRQFVRGVMRGWGEQELDTAEVVASELATNAVQHARSPFRVSISRGSSTIRIAVRDTSFALPEQLLGDVARPGGRGVQLVVSLSRAWGIRDEPDGKTVWADVARAPLA
jgi:anti-sigma regulatory factor (Ser/Thr protein kinase)